MTDRYHVFPTVLGAPFLLFALTTLAATTGTILLTGSIPLACSVTINAQTVSRSLDLSQSQAALLVANVIESCNDSHGYRVTIGTINGSTSGLLKGTGSNPDVLPYAVIYNGTPTTFLSGSALITSAIGTTPVEGITKPLAIAYAGAPGLTAGIYTDTLTVTITAN